MCRQFDFTKAKYIHDLFDEPPVAGYYLCHDCGDLVVVSAYTPENLPILPQPVEAFIPITRFSLGRHRSASYSAWRKGKRP